MTLSIEKVTAQGRVSVPFRVVSSGGGKNLTVHYVAAAADLLEDKAVRQQKVRLFLEWMTVEVKRQGQGSHLTTLAQGQPKILESFEEQYIHNPPGDYEIAARYTPVSRGDHWTGTLVSAPLRVRISDGPDFFDLLKERMGKGQESRK